MTDMKLRESISRWVALIGIAVFGLLWFCEPTFSADEAWNALIRSTLYHVMGSIIFAALTVYLGFRLWHKPQKAFWVVFLPSLLVVVNNFPFIALANGEAQITRGDMLPLFVIDCLLIGVFEELAFRGTLYLAILEKRRSTRTQLFWTTVVSSAVFGLVHLANLFEGAGVGATLLQVGYSFLIGGMCSIVFLKSRNIFLPIVLHGVFDIGGRLIDTVGEGRIWNLPTVIITAVLGVLVTVWMLWQLLRIDPRVTDAFYPTKENDMQV